MRLADVVASWPEILAAYGADRVVVPADLLAAYREAAIGILDASAIGAGEVDRVEFVGADVVLGAQVAIR